MATAIQSEDEFLAGGIDEGSAPDPLMDDGSGELAGAELDEFLAGTTRGDGKIRWSDMEPDEEGNRRGILVYVPEVEKLKLETYEFEGNAYLRFKAPRVCCYVVKGGRLTAYRREDDFHIPVNQCNEQIFFDWFTVKEKKLIKDGAKIKPRPRSLQRGHVFVNMYDHKRDLKDGASIDTKTEFYHSIAWASAGPDSREFATYQRVMEMPLRPYS